MKNKLLIVDDQSLYLRSLKHVLSAEFDVVTARSMPETMDLLAAETFSVALIDIRLDEKDDTNTDGLSILEWITNNRPETSCFVMSMYKEFHYAEQALNLGARHFFRKPIDVAELMRVIQEKG